MNPAEVNMNQDWSWFSRIRSRSDSNFS